MSNRKSGETFRVQILTGSEELMGKLIDLIGDEYGDDPDFEIDMNYDSSNKSKTIKINFKNDRRK